MATQTQTDFMEIVKGRRSIRNYDTDVKISKEEMTQILEEATLAPSSVNMQPWRFLVIDSEEGKATLAPLAKFNQVQVETSSAVIAVFGDMNAVDQLENIYDTAVAKGLMPQEVRDRQVPAIQGMYSSVSANDLKDSILIDSGLVSMQLMLVARAHGYDTNPIGMYRSCCYRSVKRWTLDIHQFAYQSTTSQTGNKFFYTIKKENTHKGD